MFYDLNIEARGCKKVKPKTTFFGNLGATFSIVIRTEKLRVSMQRARLKIATKNAAIGNIFTGNYAP